jgi:hypothetical protein
MNKIAHQEKKFIAVTFKSRNNQQLKRGFSHNYARYVSFFHRG